RIAFMGSDAIALPILRFLFQEDGLDLTVVYTQPDRPSGRGKRLRPNPIKEWAVANQVEVRDPSKLEKSEDHWLREAGLSFAIVMAYGHILKPSFLKAIDGRFYNLHASLLPAYRGASPVETALAEGEKKTGVSLMRIISRMDAGPVIDREETPIGENEDGSSLRKKLSLACIPLLKRNLEGLVSGNPQEQLQVEQDASYCRRLRKVDGRLDFSLPASSLALRVAAFRTWPGCFFEFGEARIKVGSAKAITECVDAAPSEILGEIDGCLRVATGQGILALRELQRPGGAMLPAIDFLRGFALPAGTQLSTAPTDPLVGDKPSFFSENEKTG
ncbi:MAG: methionyl-tRNA formyltransferase, partial [Opitutales bacterium]